MSYEDDAARLEQSQFIAREKAKKAERARKLAAEGLSLTEITKRLKMGGDTVRRILAESQSLRGRAG